MGDQGRVSSTTYLNYVSTLRDDVPVVSPDSPLVPSLLANPSQVVAGSNRFKSRQLRSCRVHGNCLEMS